MEMEYHLSYIKGQRDTFIHVLTTYMPQLLFHNFSVTFANSGPEVVNCGWLKGASRKANQLGC